MAYAIQRNADDFRASRRVDSIAVKNGILKVLLGVKTCRFALTCVLTFNAIAPLYLA